MNGESGTVASLRRELCKFSGIISKSFKKPIRRLIKEMLHGIKASKGVKLSNIPIKT
jgi:Cu/Ag efflux pump CusA